MATVTTHPKTVEGFRAAGIACGIKGDDELDLALITSSTTSTVSGIFTSNQVKAAPVLYDQSIIQSGRPIRAVLINSGNANACTGEMGLINTIGMAERASRHFKCHPEDVLILSTGVIGVQLPMRAVLTGIDTIGSHLHEDGWADAATAIMTTDTHPKIASITTDAGYTITGIAKGAGMIAPNMATMLAVIVTDASISREMLDNALTQAANASFNRIVIDGDMSTNDSALVLANGASGIRITPGDESFGESLTDICKALAQAIVMDAEGATKMVTLLITGAVSNSDAHTIANAIAASPLCKTAFFGADPNWGRFVAAAGRSSIAVRPERLALWVGNAVVSEPLQLVKGGEPVDYDEQAAIALMQADAFTVRLDLGLGSATATVWTCDLSHDYVTINSDYRT